MILKYAPDNSGIFKNFIDNTDFKIPKYISAEQWNQFPIVRKIEMLYIAAEKKNKGFGGSNFLAFLSNHLAQTYEAVNFDPRLQSLINKKVKPNKLEFKSLTKKYKVDLPRAVKKQIFTIAQYADAGALGGPQTIMSHYFGLSDDIVYDFLSTSNSNAQAMERGLAKSKVPPSHKKRLSRICRDLQNNFEGASFDDNLTKIGGYDKGEISYRNRPDFKGSVTEKLISLESTNIDASKTKMSTKYQAFKTENYGTSKEKVSLEFNKMIRSSKGWGGVVFGNKLVDNTNLPDVDYVLFVPSKKIGRDSLQMGTLEFVFNNDKVIRHTGVFAEDVLAGFNILFNSESDYKLGEGIGLVGITNGRREFDPERSCWEVILHPEIANLKLGWSALLCDVYPLAKEELSSKLKGIDFSYEDLINLNYFLQFKGRTYKITDVPLSVNSEENKLTLKRINDEANDDLTDIYIKMQSFYTANFFYEENTEFNELSPFFINNILEYYRLNELAQTIALLRWAKMKGAKKMYKPAVNIKQYIAPESICVKSGLIYDY